MILEELNLYEKPLPSEICHHQIDGAKWHVRNGPPYPLGKGQLSSSEKKAGSKVSISAKIRDGLLKKSEKSKAAKAVRAEKKAQKEAAKEEPKVIKTEKKKQLSKMRDQDLSASINRLEQEKRYKELMYDVYGNKGKAYLKEQMARAGADALSNASRKTGEKVLNALFTRAVNKAAGQELIGLDDAVDGLDKKLQLETRKFERQLQKDFERAKEAEAKKAEKAQKEQEKKAQDYGREYVNKYMNEKGQYLLEDKNRKG